ncbi:hypothetical protein MO973_37635 [Paenibacillus sp. TRM 82003]|uniref:hypothetical protein n=1 Tax=Kineococcus sp. TRM81007 TaxID=2925831 RepID=UPI001F586AEC|nr:hypothetical protein [Kineococcus sp. TRM81007]MCI2239768.1 hypothetical protein [Kineococcus sp. TRM81007]MCI3925928.1 hypothetical protein [Paenibacillus sp. TRM 82003]
MPDRPVPRPSSQRGGGPARSPLLTAVAVTVVLEAVLLVAGAAYLVHGLLVEDATEPVAAVVLALTTLAFAAGLALCAHGLLQRAAWARSPVLVWQLLQLAAGWPAFSGGSPWLGVLLVVPAALVLVGLFLPPVSAQLSR